MITSDLKKTEHYLIVSFFSLATPLLLFIFRAFDDNKLTSWQWTFSNTNVLMFFFVLVSCVLLAFVFSRISITERSPFFLFFSSFAIATLFWGEPEVIVDGSRYFSQAKQLATHGIGYFFSEWGKDVFAWTDLPLIPFCYGLILKYLGESRTFIQMFTSLLFSGTVTLTFFLGRMLWDEEVGFYGGLLLLGFPYLLIQVPLMLVDVPTMFFLLLAVFSFTGAIKNGGPMWIVFAVVSLFLAFFAKYSTGLFLSGTAVVTAVNMKAEPWSSLKRGGTVMLLFLLCVGIAFFFEHEVMTEQIQFLINYQKPGLRRWGESFTSTFLFQVHAFISVCAVFSVYVFFRKKDFNYLIVAWFIFLIIFLQVKRIRYTVPVFPMLSLMAAYGIKEIKDREIKSFFAFCIVNTSLAVAFLGYLPFLHTMSPENLKNAGSFLNAIASKHIEVVVLPQEKKIVNPDVSVPLLDLFTNKKITLIDYIPKQPPEGFEESPLRFTWEYQTPSFYYPGRDNLKTDALVVIASRPDQPLPFALNEKIKEYQKKVTFDQATGLFLYKTLVQVYY